MAAEEDPFELIKKGNAFEAASDHWRAAEYYGSASARLRRRADDLAAQLGGVRAGGAAEQRQVASLYRAQSLEYVFKARHCLLEALRFENAQDRARCVQVAGAGTGSLDPLCSLLDPGETQKRQLTFERLFSGGGVLLDRNTEEVCALKETASSGFVIETKHDEAHEAATGNASKSPTAAIDDANSSHINSKGNSIKNVDKKTELRQQSIESRLAELDSACLPAVPAPFVAGSRTSGGGDTRHRLEDIRRGLGRLGVSLPDDRGGKAELIPDSISTEEQVSLVLQQARDEVRVEQGRHVGEGSAVNATAAAPPSEEDAIDENDSMFEGFEDEDADDIAALLKKAEHLVAQAGLASTGGGAFSSELGHIRKAQALLLEARLCLEMEQEESSEEDTSPTASENIGHDDKKQEGLLSEEVSEKSVEKEPPASAVPLASRKKARELITTAQGCMYTLLKEWK